jgi:hypothetical protein
MMQATAVMLAPTVSVVGTQITPDAAGVGYNGTGTPTWTHVIGATANFILVGVTVAYGYSPGTLLGVTATCGGVAMNPVGITPAYVFNTTGYIYANYVFALMNPGAGSKTINVTVSNSSVAVYIAANSMSFNNVYGIGNVYVNESTVPSANPSQTVPSATGQMIAQVIGGYSSAFSAYTKTQRYLSPPTTQAMVMGDATGAATVTLGCTAVSDYWGAISVQLLPLPAAAGITCDFTGISWQYGASSAPQWPHQIGSGANCLVVAATLNCSAALTNCTCKVGATTVTKLANTANYVSGGISYVYLFALMNPPTGIQNIILTPTGGGSVYASANSVSYKGVTSLGTAATASGSAANPSQTIAAAIGNVVVWALGGYINNNISAFNGLIRHNNGYVSTYAVPCLVGDIPGAASTVLSATAPADAWGSIALPMYSTPLALFDLVGSTGNTTASPVTFTDNIPVNTNCAVVWIEATQGATATAQTVTCTIGGVPATLAMQQICTNNNGQYLTCFVLQNPPTGNQTIQVTCTGPINIIFVKPVYYDNVDSIGTPVSVQAGAQPTLSITNTDPRSIYANAFSYQGTTIGNTFSGYNRTQRFLQALVSGVANPLIIGDAYGNNGTLAFSATRSDTTYNYGGIILPLLANKG